MGLTEEILKSFYSKLSANEDIPETVVEKLRELFDNGTVDEESLLKLLKEISHDD